MLHGLHDRQHHSLVHLLLLLATQQALARRAHVAVILVSIAQHRDVTDVTRVEHHIEALTWRHVDALPLVRRRTISRVQLTPDDVIDVTL